MTNLLMQNLLFFVPMAIAGVILCGEVPVASKLARAASCVPSARYVEPCWH